MAKGIVVNAAPDVIVISGDLANQPVPWQMKKAAGFVKEIKEQCKPALTIVIPGNHDFKFWGNVGLRRLSRIPFEIYFRKDGLDKKWWSRTGEALKLMFNALGWRGQSMREPVGIYLLPEKPDLGLAIFTINSNSLAQMMAAGKVESHDLQELYRKVEEAEKSPDFAFRYSMAVVHHHPAPLANAPLDALACIQDSFMIFYNAGLFVTELSRRGFNAVLHGHRHVAGFLRMSCEFRDTGRSTLSVIAAGTATHPAPDDTRGHEMNIIEIYDDDTARLEQRFYDANIDRKDESRYFALETLDDVRLRRNAIFRTKQKYYAGEIRKTVQITKDGYSEITNIYRDVRALTYDGVANIKFCFTTARPCYLRFGGSSSTSAFETCELDEQTLYSVTGTLNLRKTYLPDSGSFRFGYRYRVMNGHVLTAEEFVRHYMGTSEVSEWSSISADVACDLATLNIQFPAEYNLDLLDFEVVAEYMPAPLKGIEGLDFGLTKRHDSETERVSGYVQPQANGYELACPKPIPGMIYKLVWRFKDLNTDRNRNLVLAAEIADAKDRLLAMCQSPRTQAAELDHGYAEAIVRALVNDINSAIAATDEDLHIGIMVFDDDSRRLRTVYSNVPNSPVGDFYSGEGCAGIAFEKSRCVLYHAARDDIGYFIHQKEWEAETNLEEATVLLSIPWVHISEEDQSIYVVGVVNVSSTRRSTKLLSLFGKSGPDTVKAIQDLANWAACRLETMQVQ